VHRPFVRAVLFGGCCEPAVWCGCPFGLCACFAGKGGAFCATAVAGLLACVFWFRWNVILPRFVLLEPVGSVCFFP
jgi:hypothetical protein